MHDDGRLETPTEQHGARTRSPSRGVAAGIGVIIAAAAVVLGSWSGVADARAGYESAVDLHESARGAYHDAVDELVEARHGADAPLELARGAGALELDSFADPEVTATLIEAGNTLDALASSPLPDDGNVRTVLTDTLWPPSLREATADLETGARGLDDRAGRLRRLAGDVRDATARLEEAGNSLVSSTAASVPRVEESAVSAANADRMAFRHAAAVVSGRIGHWDSETVAHLASYVTAAQRLVASNAAEEQEKAGALFAQRMEVEAFARSLAGGVLLEFDWAPVVNGFGQGGSYGGTATATAQDAPQATIALSDSIARDWPWSDIGRAVVVHEVGHAMTSKCASVFTPVTRQDHEAWATAWAIGMGYDGNGSGESLYGRPSDELIGLAQACR